MDVKTWEWITRKPYPFESQIYGARSLYYQGSFLVFGGTGEIDNELKRIAAYTPKINKWTEIGFMKSGRSYTSAISFDEEFLIIGARFIVGDKQSEKFYYNGNAMISQYQAPYMSDLGNTYRANNL